MCRELLKLSWSGLKMSEKGLIYSFVAKGTVVLAEHTPYSGNFSTVAVQCLQKLPTNSSKYTYSCDGYTFNFLLDSGFGDTFIQYYLRVLCFDFLFTVFDRLLWMCSVSRGCR